VGKLDFVVKNIEVKIELTGVFGFEFAAFELEGHETLEAAVEEQQVDKEFFVCDFETILVAEETEAGAHSEDEVLDIGYDFFFRNTFIFGVDGTDEVYKVFVAEYLEGRRFKGRQGFVEIVGEFALMFIQVSFYVVFKEADGPKI
jgi:hypothetical protein